jgi:hypothetical protein
MTQLDGISDTADCGGMLGVESDRGRRIAFETQQGGRLMKSRTQRSAFIAFLLVVTVGVWATPALAQGNRPRTEPVSGEFNTVPENVMTRSCAGEDGPYIELRGRWTGTITGSDPRLTGNLEVLAQSALVNVGTAGVAAGFGTFHGTFSVSDATGAQTARGEFSTVVTDGFINHGFATGKVMGQNGPADDFFARFQSTIDGSLQIHGFFGLLSPVAAPPFADPRTPAVIQGGTCTGPWTRIKP